MKKLIIEPLQTYSSTATLVILIDALDELTERSVFLKLLAKSVSKLPTWVKILVTSRPDADILEPFERIERRQIRSDGRNARFVVFYN